MFCVNATFEDFQIIATEQPPQYDKDGVMIRPENGVISMDVHLVDNHSGNVCRKTMDLRGLGKLVAYAASGQDGEDLAITCEEIHALLGDCPPQCRPIP